jgi:hypothetical protein
MASRQLLLGSVLVLLGVGCGGGVEGAQVPDEPTSVSTPEVTSPPAQDSPDTRNEPAASAPDSDIPRESVQVPRPSWLADWSESEPLSLPIPFLPYKASLALGEGVAYVGWVAGQELAMDGSDFTLRVHRWDGVAWTQLGPEVPHPEAIIGHGSPISMVVDAQGMPLRAWRDARGLRVERWNGREWNSLVSGVWRGRDPERKPDCLSLRQHSGQTLLMWREAIMNGPGGAVFVGRYESSNGRWTLLGEEGLPPSSDARFWSCPRLAFDANGRPMIAWDETVQDDSGRLSVRRVRVARWQEGVRAWRSLGSPLGNAVGGCDFNAYPSLSLAADGSPLVSWMTCTGSARNIEVQRFDAVRDSWLPVGERLGGQMSDSRNSFPSAMNRDAKGRPLLLWLEVPRVASPEGFFLGRYEEGEWKPLWSRRLKQSVSLIGSDWLGSDSSGESFVLVHEIGVGYRLHRLR